MSRGGRVATGLGILIVILLLWLFARGRQSIAGGDVTLGDIFFGGYEPGNITITRPPRTPIELFFNWEAPSPGVLPGGQSDTPCDCGCKDITLNFADLTDFANSVNGALRSQVERGVQTYFATNPWAYNFANANRIKEFAD